MHFQDIFVVAGMAAGASALLARNDPAVIVHQVVSFSESVVFSTHVETVVSCGPDVTYCPESSGVIVSIVDSTTTVCPVTSMATISASGTEPGKTITVSMTQVYPSTGIAWTSTVTGSGATGASGSAGQPTTTKAPGSTLVSPEDTDSGGNMGTVTSTSFVHTTITVSANSSSLTFSPNNTTITTIPKASSNAFSTDAVGPLFGTASSMISNSANGTFVSATGPPPVVAESIVPYTGVAVRAMGSPFVGFAVLAAFALLA